jgi:hypothetical protein
MAIVVKFAVSNTTAETDELLRRLETAGALAPEGQLFHVCYGSRDNLPVINVYDSPQSLEQFGKILTPILDELGIKAQPEVDEVYKLQSASDDRPHLS